MLTDIILGNTPDSIYNQMIYYNPKFTTFHSAYLNKKVNFNLQNTFLKENTKNQLYKLFIYISLIYNPYVTRDIVP